MRSKLLFVIGVLGGLGAFVVARYAYHAYITKTYSRVRMVPIASDFDEESDAATRQEKFRRIRARPSIALSHLTPEERCAYQQFFSRSMADIPEHLDLEKVCTETDWQQVHESRLRGLKVNLEQVTAADQLILFFSETLHQPAPPSDDAAFAAFRLDAPLRLRCESGENLCLPVELCTLFCRLDERDVERMAAKLPSSLDQAVASEFIALYVTTRHSVSHHLVATRSEMSLDESNLLEAIKRSALHDEVLVSLQSYLATHEFQQQVASWLAERNEDYPLDRGGFRDALAAADSNPLEFLEEQIRKNRETIEAERERERQRMEAERERERVRQLSRESFFPTQHEFNQRCPDSGLWGFLLNDRGKRARFYNKLEMIRKYPDLALDKLTDDEKKQLDALKRASMSQVPEYMNLACVSPSIQWSDKVQQQFGYAKINFDKMTDADLIIILLHGIFEEDGDFPRGCEISERGTIEIPLLASCDGACDYPFQLGWARYSIDLSKVHRFAWNLPDRLTDDDALVKTIDYLIQDCIECSWRVGRLSDEEKEVVKVDMNNSVNRIRPLISSFVSSPEAKALKERLVAYRRDDPDRSFLDDLIGNFAFNVAQGTVQEINRRPLLKARIKAHNRRTGQAHLNDERELRRFLESDSLDDYRRKQR